MNFYYFYWPVETLSNIWNALEVHIQNPKANYKNYIWEATVPPQRTRRNNVWNAKVIKPNEEKLSGIDILSKRGESMAAQYIKP